MLNTVSIPEIENVASTHKELEKKEPFRVIYPKDNMWQIYYSENTRKYFMLVCSKEDTFAEFFYLLKKKIEFSLSGSRTAPKIYVPINAMNYSEEFLNRNEIADLENYLWLFTKNWAMIFEVYSKSNALSIQIVGETLVYDNVKSSYKIKLTNREDAIKFYKLLKALFILQTEIKNHFQFTTKIDSNNGLELYLGKIQLTYDMLTEFIKNEFQMAQEEIRTQNDNIREIEEELDKIRESVKEKEDEYLIKQKEISTYLEYKKTFFGKVKVFFKGTKIAKVKENIENKESSEENVKGQKKSEIISVEPFLKEKNYYTLEDLVTVYHIKEKNDRQIKNIMQIENNIERMKKAFEIFLDIKSVYIWQCFTNIIYKINNELLNRYRDKNIHDYFIDYPDILNCNINIYFLSKSNLDNYILSINSSFKDKVPKWVTGITTDDGVYLVPNINNIPETITLILHESIHYLSKQIPINTDSKRYNLLEEPSEKEENKK